MPVRFRALVNEAIAGNALSARRRMAQDCGGRWRRNLNDEEHTMKNPPTPDPKPDKERKPVDPKPKDDPLRVDPAEQGRLEPRDAAFLQGGCQ